jgi:hypothetical protein
VIYTGSGREDEIQADEGALPITGRIKSTLCTNARQHGLVSCTYNFGLQRAVRLAVTSVDDNGYRSYSQFESVILITHRCEWTRGLLQKVAKIAFIGEQRMASLNGLHSRDTYNQHASHGYLMGYAALFEPAQELRRAPSYVRNKQVRDIPVNVLETSP